jgi:hypothetical protein
MATSDSTIFSAPSQRFVLPQLPSIHVWMPPRAKSCAICRKKRIKCDATLPQCLMCIRTGQSCPGLPEGPLIVDMTGIAKHGMQRRKQKQLARSMEPVRPNDVIIHRISQRAMITEAFYERFLAHFTFEGEGTDIRNCLTWLHRLPSLSTDGTNEALVLAVRATASAYCAVESADLALTRHSWNLYGEALHTHSRFLSRSRSKHEVTVHMVRTPMYELHVRQALTLYTNVLGVHKRPV